MKLTKTQSLFKLTHLTASDARPRASLLCDVKQRGRAYPNSALARGSLFLSPCLRRSAASCSRHRRATADSPADAESPQLGSALSGARMRCHKFVGPCSVGFYIWTAMLFKGRLCLLSLLGSFPNEVVSLCTFLLRYV